MNWTDDSWTRQENVVVTVDLPSRGRGSALDFEQLWGDRDVERSGFVQPRPVQVDGTRPPALHAGGRPDGADREEDRARGASPSLLAVFLSAPVLGILAQRIADGSGDIAGCVD